MRLVREIRLKKRATTMAEKMRWAVLSLGYFSRNRYWGEDEGTTYRSPLCTSTFVEINGARLVIDPPVYGRQMEEMLDQRTGLTVDKIDYVFITHYHSDHYVGLGCFPKARLLAAPGDLERLREVLYGAHEKKHLRDMFPNAGELAARVEPAGKQIMPGVELVELPGHTPGLAGAMFEGPEGRIVAAGDAVMTADFFRDRLGYYNSVDFGLSKKSIEKIAEIADIVVPGHSNYFVCAAAGR